MSVDIYLRAFVKRLDVYEVERREIKDKEIQSK